jgi:hypothetical protein
MRPSALGAIPSLLTDPPATGAAGLPTGRASPPPNWSDGTHLSSGPALSFGDRSVLGGGGSAADGGLPTPPLVDATAAAGVAATGASPAASPAVPPAALPPCVDRLVEVEVGDNGRGADTGGVVGGLLPVGLLGSLKDRRTSGALGAIPSLLTDPPATGAPGSPLPPASELAGLLGSLEGSRDGVPEGRPHPADDDRSGSLRPLAGN